MKDFLIHIHKFDAGKKYVNFNDFINDEAIDYRDSGEGVTYVVWNIIMDEEGKEIDRELVSYYTLAATAIPFEDRIRNDEIDYKVTGEKYSREICGISAIEIKMFAVSVKYQDIFYEYDGQDLPISAWVMRNIIDSEYKAMYLALKEIYMNYDE